MYNSGDAAEQVVRMSLEGAEFALKITGSAAKNLAASPELYIKNHLLPGGAARPCSGSWRAFSSLPETSSRAACILSLMEVERRAISPHSFTSRRSSLICADSLEMIFDV